MKCRTSALACLLLFPFLVLSQNFRNEFGFRADNDSFLAYGQDQYYTNGLFITFRHAVNQERISTRFAKLIWEAEAGQYMFNPYTGKIDDISKVDRPFAAYLYAGGKLNLFLPNEHVFELSLNAGTIGPDALGEEVQKGLHQAIGFYPIKGWEYQVNNDLGINAALKHSALLVRNGNNDLSLNSYVNIGSTFTGVGAGILYRTGRINKFFNSVSANSRISNSAGDSIPEKEFFFFTRPMLNFIGYDATVQGGLFADDKGPVTFDPKRFQYSHEFGINYAANRWTLNFSVIFKSRDVKMQKTSHQYGSAAIYYRF
ncbi:lipid A deacylase LpxR family protein [Paradesertivirga mongoliensis]|uniref:Lipid A deacylase LpxR family protein n=1 Tax=Paradesertivirga mongoliensis TaxID=2100740 RepID=A0ABW4ZLB4_9SPHI|nr:lipid A deacylase LpxR family protein [Pedobacter mongoliensis]